MTVTDVHPARRPFATLGQNAALAATAGLALTLVAPSAPAAHATDEATAPQAGNVTPTVVVPDDAAWEIATTEVSGSRPAPVVTRTATAASRSDVRTAVAPAAANSATAAAVLSIARRYVGVPYVSGGSTPAGFDCSGFTMYVFAQVGVSLPRSSAAQRYAGTVVSASQAQPGDLVWWPGHVGIYTGNGQHIAARSPGTALYEGPLYGSPIYLRVL